MFRMKSHYANSFTGRISNIAVVFMKLMSERNYKSIFVVFEVVKTLFLWNVERKLGSLLVAMLACMCEGTNYIFSWQTINNFLIKTQAEISGIACVINFRVLVLHLDLLLLSDRNTTCI